MTTEPDEQQTIAVEVDPEKVPKIKDGVVVEQEGSNVRVILGDQNGSDE